MKRACLSLFFCITALGPVLAAPKPLVAVSIAPQAWFVERISGSAVDCLTIVGPGQDPHRYEPSPRQMSLLAKGALWFTIGIDFEKALAPRLAASLLGLKQVDMAAGATRRPMEAHAHGEGDHDEEMEESLEGAPDPHVWLGREGALAMAAAALRELSLILPPRAAEFSRNHVALVRDIDAAFASLKTELAPLRGKPVFVYHPAFGYFLDEFGIRQVAVETGGKEPTQKGISELIVRARAEGARVIFVQPQFPSRSAEALARGIGGSVLPLDDLATDWLDNLWRMGRALRDAAAVGEGAGASAPSQGTGASAPSQSTGAGTR